MKKKVVSISAFQIAGMGVSLVNSIITARWLGPEGRGILTIAYILPQIISSLGMLGMFEAIVFTVSKKDKDHSEILDIAIIASILFGCLYVIVLSLIFPLLKNNILRGLTFQLALIASASIPFAFLRNSISQYLFAIGEVARYNWNEILFLLLQLLAGVILIIIMNYGTAGGVWSILAAYITGALISILLGFKWVRRSVRHRPTKGTVYQLWNYGLKSFAGGIANKLNYRLDMFFVNYFAGPAAVGIYGVSARIAELSLFFPRILRMVRFTEVASESQISEESVLRTARLFRQIIIIVLLTFPIYGLSASIGIRILYGRAFDNSVNPMLILLIGSAFLSVTMVIFSHLTGSGKPHLTSIASWISLMVTVFLDVLFIPEYGVMGAAIASSIVYGIYFYIILRFTKKEHPLFINNMIPRITDFKELILTIKKIKH